MRLVNVVQPFFALRIVTALGAGQLVTTVPVINNRNTATMVRPENGGKPPYGGQADAPFIPPSFSPARFTPTEQAEMPRVGLSPADPLFGASAA